MRYYTKNHEWVDIEDTKATIGITQYAIEQLGDIVFVELPKIGAHFKQDGEVALIESTKATSDIYAPISGDVIEINQELVDTPEVLNTLDGDQIWFFKMNISNFSDIENLLKEPI